MKPDTSKSKKSGYVGRIILHTVTGHALLLAGIVISVVAAVVLALLPPLILGNIVDTLTIGKTLPFQMAVLYFAMLALTGVWTEDNSCGEKQYDGKAYKAAGR